MIVFSQGYEVAVAQYSSLLSSWASAGFVVAAPTYPHTATSDPADLDEADIVNHPADLRLVLSSLVADSSHPGWVLSGMINGDEIGLAGHSDGGEVSLAVADNTCCRYTGVKALAVLSGAELTSFGGEYFPGTSPPLLVVQGNADTVNPPACSAQIFDSAPQPKYYLDLLGAGHLTPYIQPTAYEGVVARTTTAFFAAELAGQAAELAALPSVADVGNVATLTTAPATTGDCPGAP
jgi:predicted dienelactone hydrolase